MPYIGFRIVVVDVRLFDGTVIAFKVHFELVAEHHVHAANAGLFQMAANDGTGHRWPSVALSPAPEDHDPTHDECHVDIED